MLKYVEVQVGFSEVPEEIALCINISGCPIHCKGCHSPHLWKDIGKELTIEALKMLIARNSGITCVAFMGGDASPDEIETLAKWVKNKTGLKVCWYSGRKTLTLNNNFVIAYDYFDYIKVGPYEEDKGGLNEPTTNQRFYEVKHVRENDLAFNMLEDITFKFQRK